MHLKQWINSRNWLDRFGMGLSLLCAVHCLITPFYFLVFPFLAESHGIEFHLLMIALVLPVALLTLWRSYKRHNNATPLIFGAIGIVFLLLGVAAIEIYDHATTGIWLDRVLTSIGSLSLIVGHWKNLKQCSCNHH